MGLDGSLGIRESCCYLGSMPTMIRARAEVGREGSARSEMRAI